MPSALQPAGLTFNCMTDAMFEPSNWRSFKSFVIRVRDKAEKTASISTTWASQSMDSDAGETLPQQGKPPPTPRGRPVFA